MLGTAHKILWLNVFAVFLARRDREYRCNFEFREFMIDGCSRHALKETTMSTKKPSNEQTSRRVASLASKVLSNPKSSAAEKSVAASALTQARNRKK